MIEDSMTREPKIRKTKMSKSVSQECILLADVSAERRQLCKIVSSIIILFYKIVKIKTKKMLKKAIQYPVLYDNLCQPLYYITINDSVFRYIC